MSLKVDPGSYSAMTARFIRASAGASFATLGLNFGQFASPRISPVFGFITITVPAIACVLAIAAASSRSAMYWIFSSSVRTTFAPGSRRASPPSNQRCRASAITMIFSLLPRIWLSNSYSIPPKPFSSRSTKPSTCDARSRFG